MECFSLGRISIIIIIISTLIYEDCNIVVVSIRLCYSCIYISVSTVNIVYNANVEPLNEGQNSWDFRKWRRMSTCVQYNPITANLVNANAFPCARKNVLVHAGFFSFTRSYCKIVLSFSPNIYHVVTSVCCCKM